MVIRLSAALRRCGVYMLPSHAFLHSKRREYEAPLLSMAVAAR